MIGGAHPSFNAWLEQVHTRRPASSNVILYGHPDSSTSRSLWMARELEALDALRITNVIPERWDEETDEMNPHRKVPFLDDGGVHVFESMAINIYLAKKYGGSTSLSPKDLSEEAVVLKWSVWAAQELFLPLWELIITGPARVDSAHPWYTHPVVRNPNTPDKRNQTGEERFMAMFSHPRSAIRERRLVSVLRRNIGALEKALQGREYLMGDRFTVADLNVCSYLAWTRHLGWQALEQFPSVKAYLVRCSFERRTSPQYEAVPYDGPWKMHYDAKARL